MLEQSLLTGINHQEENEDEEFGKIVSAFVLAGAMTSLAAAQEKDGAAKGSKPGGVVVDVIKWTERLRLWMRKPRL